MKTPENAIRWLGLALACGTLTFAVTTQAGKQVKPPPNPGIEPGIVFYAQSGYVKVANSDGSGIQNLFPVVNWSEFPRPSDLSHSGSYWFLTVRNDGSDNALVAIDESGTQVGLDTSPGIVGGSSDFSNQRWLAGDSKLAFIGSVPDQSTPPNYVSGLFLMDIYWSSGQPRAAGAPQLIAWTVPLMSAGSAFSGGFTFSADGNTIYFPVSGDLFKADVATGTPGGPLVANFTSPELSADGSKLVGWLDGYPVQTVGTDGAGLTAVVPGSGVPVSGSRDYGILAFWSPTGQNIVFTHVVWLNKRVTSMSEQVTIVSASGTVLGTVGDKLQLSRTLGWRPAR